MMCQVIVQNYCIGRRLSYMFLESDFKEYERKRQEPVDATWPRIPWCDLSIRQLHDLIILAIDEDAVFDDARVGTETNELAFLVACLLLTIQDRTNSEIDLMKISVVGQGAVVYDYASTLAPDLTLLD